MSADDDAEPLAEDVATILADHTAKRRPQALPRLVADALRLVLRAARGVWFASAALQVVVGVAAVVQVWATQRALRHLVGVVDPGRAVREAVPAGLAAGGAIAVVVLAGAALGPLARLLAERVERSVLRDILGVTSGVPLERTDDPSYHDLLQRVGVNAASQPQTVSAASIAIVGGLVGSVALGATVWAIHPLTLPVLVVATAPAVLVARVRGRLEFRFAVRRTELLRRKGYLEGVLSDRNLGKEVRSLEMAPALMARWRGITDESLDLLGAHLRKVAVLDAAQGLTSLLGAGLTAALLGVLVHRGSLDLADAGAALVAIYLLADRLRSLAASVGALFTAGPFLAEIARFREEPIEPVAGEAQPPFEALTVEGVHYRYPGAAGEALRGVSLTVRRGEVVALVGENGSGKTTLAKLLVGLLPATAGTVAWDGSVLRPEDLPRVRSSTAVLFQDFARFELTAFENVTAGNPAATAEELAAAATWADVDEIIASLPRGWETPLSRRFAGGRDLSLGQWQRVALARAMLRQRPFLVLDEPTASLDPRAERDLFNRVQELGRERTVVLITHRLTSVRRADRIVVLSAGEVVETGTHAELVAADGHYAELYRMQAETFGVDV